MVAIKRAAVVVDTSRSSSARLRPVPLTAVQLDDAFWEPRRRFNRHRSLHAQYEQLEATGRIDNFRRAAGKQAGPHQGFYFNDSDVYKWLEAAAWTMTDPAELDLNLDLDRLIDDVIQELADAQESDGYLDTYYQLGRGTGRWTELTVTHELYCAGHLIQAVVAHHRATGKTRLLAIAQRFADLICATLGPVEDGKQPGTDGHEEIEMAMVELARETGERRYLDQARYFLDARGHGLVGGDEYHQDHKPFRDLDAMVGHAVRALYLNIGAADIYAETGEPALLATLERLWENMTSRRMYVNGAVGSRYEGEAFGDDYELPNARAYTETCAAIASVMWNWRMLAIDGDARYADLMEHTLYNAMLPGLALDGLGYFYRNPLSSDGTDQRQPWYECACCPPNVARTLASLPGYLYSTSDDGVWVHLYSQSAAELVLSDGRVVRIRQQTLYPWDGDIEIGVDGEGAFTLHVRIPGWSNGVTLHINGAPHVEVLQPGTYVAIHRDWQHGDRIRLHIPMPVRLVEAHPYVFENAGRRAVFRGPILYCMEQADNGGVDPRAVTLPAGVDFVTEHQPGLLGGVTTLRVDVPITALAEAWDDRLYRPAGSRVDHSPQPPEPITLIPYYAWGNRTPGRMDVWLRSS